MPAPTSSNEAFPFDVFLSHASEDTAWCEQLAVRLRSAGVRVWFDRWQLKPGHNLDDRINHGLEHSRKLVAVWTEHYFADSKVWTLAESHAALNEEVLIPLLRRDCKIKPTLRGLLHLDFRNDADFELRFNELLEALKLPKRETSRTDGPRIQPLQSALGDSNDLPQPPTAKPLDEAKVRPEKDPTKTHRPGLSLEVRFRPFSFRLALQIGLALVVIGGGVWWWAVWSTSPDRKDAAAWRAAETLATEAAYSDYTNKWPAGRHVAEAIEGISVCQQVNSRREDDAAWRAAETLATEDAYFDYTNKWPSGSHVAEARERIADETAWAAAKQAPSISGVQAYLSAFPNGLHLSEASALLEKLKSAAEPSAKPQLGKPWTNTLGMAFAPVQGTEVLFGVWDVRVQDFAAFAADSAGNGGWDYRKGAAPFILKSDGLKRRYWEYGWDNPGFAQTPEHPVVCVSWEDATNFCAWLTKLERAKGKLNASQSYRLPADWEWSVAVGLNEPQTGTPREKDEMTPGMYPWGTNWPPMNGREALGNYAGSEVEVADRLSGFTIGGFRDGFPQTSPVGSFPANLYGLYDLGGNVWQWCEDWYDSGKTFRVLRGGSWLNVDPWLLLASCRGRGTPGGRVGGIGFRCVLVVGGSVR